MTQEVESKTPDQATPEEAAPRPAEPAPAVPSSASRRVRARLARRITAQRHAAVKPVLEPLVAVHREVYPKADLTLLQRAYDVADERHADQMRKSGDPYITHPLAVANILAELGMDTITLVAALLHDTVEDTAYTVEALERDFGPEVAHLVDGVTKLDKVNLGTAAEARDDPQDDHRDGARPAGARHQGGRPVAQHAHHAVPAAGEAGAQGEGDARGHRAARAPARHGHGQVGTRGPVVRDPAPEEVRRDRPPRRRPRALARHVSGEGARGDQHDAVGVADQRGRRGQAQALLVDLPEDDRQGPRLRRHPRPRRRAHPVRRGARLLCGRRRRAFVVAADGRAGSRTTSPSRGSGCTSRCTPP